MIKNMHPICLVRSRTCIPSILPQTGQDRVCNKLMKTYAEKCILQRVSELAYTMLRRRSILSSDVYPCVSEDKFKSNAFVFNTNFSTINRRCIRILFYMHIFIDLNDAVDNHCGMMFANLTVFSSPYTKTNACVGNKCWWLHLYVIIDD